MRRALSWALAAAAFALLLPATASATTRYAAPGGSDADASCTSTACTLQRAVAVAQSGDDVQLASGDYTLGADPFCSGALQVDHLYIHGVIGRPRPRIIGPADACVAVELNNLGAMSDLEVDGNGASIGYALGVNAFGRAFRVITGGTNGTVWVQSGGLLLDSVARAGNQTDAVATYNSLESDQTGS
jgi:hypothetical protein